MSRKKPSLVARFFFLLNNALVLITWAAYLAWFINPSTFPLSGILALAVPVFIALNIVFIIFWLIFHKRYAWLSVITVALGWWHIIGLVNISSNSKSNEETFRVMSFNSKYYFAGFTWAKTYAPKEEVQSFIKEIDPDIFCIQEFQKAKDWVPQHKLKYRFLSRHNSSHLAIYSAYPFLNSGEIEYPDKTQEYDKFIFADVLRGNDTIRIMVAHLGSFGLEEEDLSNIKNFDKLPEEEITNSSKNIFSRLNGAYKKHGIQVSALIDFIKQSPYPVLFFGDLNDTPTSYAYRKLTNHLDDSFRQAGSGFGTSHVKFSKNKLPLRIDHILIDKKFKAASWRVAPVEFSDHHPVYADIFLTN